MGNCTCTDRIKNNSNKKNNFKFLNNYYFNKNEFNSIENKNSINEDNFSIISENKKFEKVTDEDMQNITKGILTYKNKKINKIEFAKQNFIIAKKDDYKNHYLVKKSLGQGAFGKVYLVTHKITKLERALKGKIILYN